MIRSHYRFALAASRGAAFFAISGGAATVALVVALPLDALVKALAVVWVGCATWEAIRSVALRAGANAVREVSLAVDGGIEILDAARRARAGRLVDGSFVAPWLTIIRWRPDGAAFDRTLVVLPDMLDRESFRELRVVLRMAAV